MTDFIQESLAQDLVTILAHNDEYGKIVANSVDPNLFEGDLRIIAERCIRFWKTYSEAPKMETADLLNDILQDKNVRRSEAMRRTLMSMAGRAENINAKYAVDRIHRHTRVQLMKDAILKSAERINSLQDESIEEVEDIWNDLLRSRSVSFDPGKGLDAVSEVLAYMARKAVEFDLGVPLLTKKGIVPARGTLLLFLGFAKMGKSWFCVHVGKHNMIKQRKVLHISLEMSWEQVMQRYYQALFSVPRRYAETTLTNFNFDEKERLSGISWETVKPDFGLDSPVVADELEARMEMFGSRMTNLKVVRFAPRSLSVNGLIAYLDTLEIRDGYVPDLIILDSPYLLKQIDKDYRISLGRNLEHVRAIAVDRNCAIVATHQNNRTGDVAEDISQVQTADTVINYEKTEAESKFGLARMKVMYSREEEDKIGMVITQNLAIGQFYLHGAELRQSYFDMIKREAKEQDLENDDDET